MVLLLFCIYFWFHDFKKNNNNFTLRRLQICNEATKPIFNYSNLVYFFFMIYVQHDAKPSCTKLSVHRMGNLLVSSKDYA